MLSTFFKAMMGNYRVCDAHPLKSLYHKEIWTHVKYRRR